MTKKRITITLPEEDMKPLRELAQSRGITMSEVVHEGVRPMVERELDYEIDRQTNQQYYG